MTLDCAECGLRPRYENQRICRRCIYKHQEKATDRKSWLDFAEPGEDFEAASIRLGREVLAARRDGSSVRAIRERYGVCARTLWRWQKRALDATRRAA